MTHDFYPGQRWLSETEIESGIGTVLAVEGRQVTVLYRATMETRVYATHSAPLSRVEFKPGDEIETVEHLKIIVDEVIPDQHGVITYHGKDDDGIEHSVPELQIDHHLAIHDPASRLLAGQIDDPRWFTLRLHARHYQGLIWQSPVRGLQGARMSLVPHQLYIANQVASSPRARVLLADEVGLGKTIEACLILHRRIIQNQCERALIVVPPALINQWLVELLRRFTLSFSIYDEERCHDLESDPDSNPFSQNQFVLCSLELLTNKQRLQQAMQAGWDLLIVDEAHHLHWEPDQAGDDYEIVKTLSNTIESVLLLTATPEQLGRESHFARLHLLDAERFHDLQQFLKEEDNFEPVANLAEQLLESGQVDNELLNAVNSYGLNTTLDNLKNEPASVARQLLDLHGTSRLLFRNTRKQISGFPERVLIEHRLESDQSDTGEFGKAIFDHIIENDPRPQWLIDTIRQLRPEKCLLICSTAETALQLEHILHKQEGIRCTAFHEDMTIVQRDRAAAWFAAPDGAEVLLCSEIGSEGRNFQFAHHLILFDLPLNPDLLEQRIGRLDRIGQRSQVTIHTPYISGTAHHLLLNWYREVSNIFRAPDPVIGTLFDKTSDELLTALRDPETVDFDALINTHAQQAEEMLENLEHGREKLLSLSSFRADEAGQIIDLIHQLDNESNLPAFMEQVFDLYGVESEHHSAYREVIRPGDHMIGGHFPHLPDDGMVITHHRETALIHEDTQFLTWDHPMVISAIDMVTSGEFGNSSLAVIHHDTLPTGTSLLELIYRIDCPAPPQISAMKYISRPVVRMLLDHDGNDLAGQHPHESLTDIAMQVEKQLAAQAIKAQAEHINQLIDGTRNTTRQQIEQVIKQSMDSARNEFDQEIKRLQALKNYNPNIRDEDIKQVMQSRDQHLNYLEKSTIKLDAIRLVVVSD